MSTGKEKLLGTVKWFNNQKGYGFICTLKIPDGPDGKEEDIFAHFSSIVMDGYKSLKAGQPVTFDLQEGPKGLHATNITPTGDAPEKQFFGYTATHQTTEEQLVK